jgi:hypothetical protein
MSEALIIVGGHMTVDEVRKNMESFANTAELFIAWIPGDVGQRARQILNVMKVLFVQEWFVQLITYLMNTFLNNETPNSDELAVALKFYAERVGVVGQAPVVFEKN